MERDRTELTKALVRAGLKKAAVGADAVSSDKKMGERGLNALHPQSAAATGGGTGSVKRSGVKLAWVNPTALRKPAGRRTSAGLLKIVR